MKLEDLSLDEIEKLKEQLKQKEKEKKELLKKEKETYKYLQCEFVDVFFPKLAQAAQSLTLLKAELFENATTIFDMKRSIFGISDESFNNQGSHNLSNNDFSKTIILGRNNIDGWDDEVASAGIGRVNEWLSKQVDDKNENLIEFIRDLLKPNKEGMLKANRVLELHNRAEKMGDEELIDAVNMIKEAYRPVKTTTYVKAKMKDDDGNDVWLNLSMSQA